MSVAFGLVSQLSETGLDDCAAPFALFRVGMAARGSVVGSDTIAGSPTTGAGFAFYGTGIMDYSFMNGLPAIDEISRQYLGVNPMEAAARTHFSGPVDEEATSAGTAE